MRIWSPESRSHDSIVDKSLVQFYATNNKLKSIGEIDLLKNKNTLGELPAGKKYKYYCKGDWVFISFEFKSKGDEKYLIFGTCDTIYSKFWVSFGFDNLSLVQIDNNFINMENTEIGTSFVIENILFETDKSILKESSYNALNQLISELNKNPKLKLEISGHTDNIGTDEHNLLLSKNRSKSVVDYLVQKGIDKERLSYKGYGRTKPIADNTTENGRTKNRRVEFTIVDK
jgi:outer membrane protein OmpA-like peptidoglycan-associated protein